jgi:hypothetical protein
MKRIGLAFLLQFLVLTLSAAETPKECALCVGAVSDLKTAPAAPLPLLVQIREDDFAAAGAALDALSPAVRAKITLVAGYAIDPAKDSLVEIDAHTRRIAAFALAHGPFETIGATVDKASPEVAGYAAKRLAVSALGAAVAKRIVLPGATLETLPKLFDIGVGAYIDAVIVDAAAVKPVAAWLLEKDPAKKIFAVVAATSPNPIYDLGRALADGASRAYLAGASDAETLSALAALNHALTGDWAYDASAKIETLDAKGNKSDAPAIAFVRGEDLATLVIPQGNAAATTIVSLPGDLYQHPRRVDAAGEKEITDVGRKNGRYLIGVPPVKRPFAVTVEHSEKPQPNAVRESLEVTTKRGITVEEVIRNHQAYKSFQESIAPRYIARDATKLRFTLQAGEGLEATIAGDYFADPKGRADWVWRDFYINGVKWKYGRIPELPLIQPEKVTQLPLDLHLTNEYRYQLVRESDLLGYHTYEVRFEPPPNAPAGLPLYRGTVWIDGRTWARVRIAMVQLNLTGEVLSNEERVDFQPFARGTHAALTAADVARSDAREIQWLPADVEAQQVISAAGRASVILRSTTFTDFRIDPDDYDVKLAEALRSDARMVRETNAGLRYLEKSEGGDRVVKEGFDTSRKFLLGGIHHDAGLQFPVVPLGGIDYFNFNLWHRGIQTNVFFAGVVLAANATNPNVANTRTNLGADFFGIALPTTNAMWRGGSEQKSEAVKVLPTRLTLRAGHPFAGFGKIDVSLGVAHEAYRRDTDTAPSFVVPADTFVVTTSVNPQYARAGWTITGFYDWSQRTTWKPWGLPAEFDPQQKTYTNFGASLAKSFFLPKFQRIGAEVDYLDGQRLDRFSKYELGFFGAQKIHGIKSGSVRAEKAFLAHLSYGLVFSDQFRLEAFYDGGLLTDKLAGFRREPFQGLGIGGQTVGPYGTLLRLDIGKTVGKNAQNGFVANVVFLKLW